MTNQPRSWLEYYRDELVLAQKKIKKLEAALQECEEIFKNPVYSSYKAIARFEDIKNSILEGR